VKSQSLLFQRRGKHNPLCLQAVQLDLLLSGMQMQKHGISIECAGTLAIVCTVRCWQATMR
jgi:hypothetical protein